MSIMAGWDDRPREQPTTGIHNAICAFVEDIGWQERTFPGQANPKIVHEVVIMWELDQAMRDGRPFMQSRRYNLTLNERSNLYRDLSGWLGRPPKKGVPVDLTLMVGRPATLTLAVDDNEKVRISSIGPAMPNAAKLSIANKEPPKWIAEARSKAMPEPKEDEVPTPGDHDAPPPDDSDNLPF